MSLPLVTAVAPRWESALAGHLDASGQVRVVRRCADVAELLGVAAAGLGRLAVVSSDLRGLDRSVVDALRDHGLLVLGVHPPGDDDAERTLRRWGVRVTARADESFDGVESALAELLSPPERSDAPQVPPAVRVDAGRAAAYETDDREAGLGDAGPGDLSEGGAHRSDERHLLLDVHLDEAQDIGVGTDGPSGGSVTHGSDWPDDVVAEGRVVVVWGPTGSPGRTTVAVNLAAELADPLHPVVLVDADTYGASAAQVLAVLDEVPGVAAAARVADQGTLDRGALSRLAPEVRPGMRILTGLPRADRWPELRDAALADVLEQCRQLAHWVVVDVAAPVEQDEELSFDTSAPRRNGATLTALDAADKVVVVGTGDPVGLQRLVRGLDQLEACTPAERTVVVTRVRPGPVGPEPGRRIQEALDRFAGTGPVHLVPEDQEALDVALLQGRALCEVRPRSAARAALVRLADDVGERDTRAQRDRARLRPRRLLGRRVATA